MVIEISRRADSSGEDYTGIGKPVKPISPRQEYNQKLTDGL